MINLGKELKAAEKREKLRLKALRALQIPLYALVVSEKFTVAEVVAESSETSFTPDSEKRYGGSSPRYSGGFTSKTILEVVPDRKNLPVRTLEFYGFSGVLAGNHIKAKIPRYEEIRDGVIGPFEHEKVFYIDRGFQARRMCN